MTYFYTEPPFTAPTLGATFLLPDDIYHHAIRVRRMRVGDTLPLFDNSGVVLTVTVTAIGKRDATVNVTEVTPPPADADLPRLTVASATIASDRLDWALQKGTELGVDCFRLLSTARSQALPHSAKRDKHWRGVTVAACEQSHRVILPEVVAPVRFDEFLADDDGATRILCDASGEQSLASLLNNLKPTPDALTVIVGPEGGWTDAELDAAKNAGVRVAHLGKNILRAETAVAAVAALVRGLLN
jgi:16S rRNA (uracil1498-N3)-methyltransferase